MQAVNFSLQCAQKWVMPLCVNLSFGNTYGSHSGTSLLETYLDGAAQIGRTSIVVGSGNEGADAGHVSGRLEPNQSMQVEFAVGNYEPSLSIQIWKHPWDEVRFAVISPMGERAELVSGSEKDASANAQEDIGIDASANAQEDIGKDAPANVLQEDIGKDAPSNAQEDMSEDALQGAAMPAAESGYLHILEDEEKEAARNRQNEIDIVRLGDTRLYAYYGQPSPYQIYQEIYLDFLPLENYLTAGIWRIQLIAQSVKEGGFAMWMPAGSARGTATGFLTPTSETTLTIPSTASRVITVGAYDSGTMRLAAFSGRGYTWSRDIVKPELVAPGVDIVSCSANGGYESRSGTSMAAPFVTGSCAILMQWGIVDGNAPYLYGDKMKARLIGSAKELPFEQQYPNPQTGWGALCVKMLRTF